ncbi:MAG: hypothetical protein Q8930_07740 [Bacillota bacterium]|nr:hypothetical protein [Bacillota bacterium]
MINCIVDCRLTENERTSLSKLGLNIILCPKSSDAYEAISSHPDIQIFFVNYKNVIVQKYMEPEFINVLKSSGLTIHLSSKGLAHKYPHDIILNCLKLGDLFLHNLKYTDEAVIDNLSGDIKRINVNQGYTKCSTAVVSDRAIITSDPGICRSLIDNGIDVLYLPPGGIILEGLDYGFIGGTCGLLDKHNMAFFGSLDRYIYGKEVKDFLKKHKIDYHYLMESKLVDRGTLFTF